MRTFVVALLSLVFCAGCGNKISEVEVVREIEKNILRSADLEKYTPDSVVGILKAGNRNFVKSKLRLRDFQAQLALSAEVGQSPLAIVLSCIDSRVPVETIFDMGIGDIFVARVAGNVVSEDMLASMEYACKYIGSKVVLVLGHESCGAVNAACAGLEDGNITELTRKIHPAVELAAQDGGDPFSPEFQSRAVAYNVKVMVDVVRKTSPTLQNLEEQGKIKIIGGVFSIYTGEVTFFD